MFTIHKLHNLVQRNAVNLVAGSLQHSTRGQFADQPCIKFDIAEMATHHVTAWVDSYGRIVEAVEGSTDLTYYGIRTYARFLRCEDV